MNVYVVITSYGNEINEVATFEAPEIALNHVKSMIGRYKKEGIEFSEQDYDERRTFLKKHGFNYFFSEKEDDLMCEDPEVTIYVKKSLVQ